MIRLKIKKRNLLKSLSATDQDDHPVTFSIETGPLNGTITNFNPSTDILIYIPEKKFNGEDEFTFKATDDNGQDCNIATVSILVSNKPLKFLLCSMLGSLGFN